MNIKSAFIHFIRRKELLLLLVLIIAGISLFGWLSGKLDLASYSLSYIPIAPSSIVIFVSLSIIFLIKINFEKAVFSRLIASSLIVLVALYCLFILINYIFNFKWDMESIFISNPVKLGNVPTGRISPITASLNIFICLGLLSTGQKIPALIRHIGGSFSLLAGIISSVILIGYLYKAPLLYGSNIIPVSLPTAVCLLLFSITLLRVYESHFWTYNLIKENKVTRLLLKSFLPIVVFMIILQGFLTTRFPIANDNPTLSAALVLLIVIFVTVFVVIRLSTGLGDSLLRAEQALKESERKLFQLNLDKDRFISILSHDLKSPFSSILGLSEVLANDIRKLEIDKIEAFAQTLNKTAANTYNLLEDILIWASSKQGNIPFNPQKLSLADICRATLEILNPNAEAKNIKIDYSGTGQIKVFADVNMLKTTLRNLVSNAIKFSTPGGAIHISAMQTDSEITVLVSDNGVGIPPHNLPKLFDIAQALTTTGTAKETGTGLGLLICKEFIEHHGGKIWAESAYGKGSEIKFTLPVNNK